MVRLPRSFRAYRIAFVIAVAWLIAAVRFSTQLSAAVDGSIAARVGVGASVVAGGLVSIALVLWAESAKPKSRTTRVLNCFELVAFNLAVSVVLLELTLRGYSLVTQNPFTLPTSVKDAKLVNERRTEKMQQHMLGFPFNSEGFLDTEFQRPKPENVFRIVALGDSFGVGAVPYSHNYLTLLEQELEGLAPGMHIEVCNLGMNRTAPQHYLSLFQQIGSSLEPDLVMVGFFLGNDFVADGIEETFGSPWDAIMLYRVPARLYRMSQVNADHLEWVPQDKPSKLIIPKYVDDWRLEKPTLPRNYFLKTEAWRTRFFDRGGSEELYQDATIYLRRLAQQVIDITGRPLLLTIIPDELQVNESLRIDVEQWQREKAPGRWRFEDWDLEKPNRFLRQTFSTDDAGGIVVIDLLDALRRAEANLGRTYHLQNTHWNANGNRAAAEELGRRLSSLWHQIVE